MNHNQPEYWIIPANPTRYKLSQALNTFSYVDWIVKNQSYKPGDFVFIYTSQPVQEVNYLCVVEKLLDIGEATYDRDFWTNPEDFENCKNKKHVRLKLVEKIVNPVTMADLKNCGFTGQLQSARKLLDKNQSFHPWGRLLLDSVPDKNSFM